MPRESEQDLAATPEPAYPRYRSHYLPRTRRGWIAVVLFLGMMALAQPPVVHTFANRVEPTVLGVPFLYAYLMIVYCGLIAVLIWARIEEI